jgi:hypothetical protein
VTEGGMEAEDPGVGGREESRSLEPFICEAGAGGKRVERVGRVARLSEGEERF